MAKKEKKDVPLRKAYLIVKIDYIYDDNYYNSNENESGSGVKVCFIKERAEEIVKEMNRNKLRGNSIGRYNDGAAKESYESIFRNGKEDKDDWEMTIPVDATDKQLDRYLELGGVKFFKVEEIEVEMKL